VTSDAKPVPTIQPTTPAPITNLASISKIGQTVATSRAISVEAAGVQHETAVGPSVARTGDLSPLDTPRENLPDATSPAVPPSPRVDRVPGGGMIEIGVPRRSDRPTVPYTPVRDDGWRTPQRPATDHPRDESLGDEHRDALPSADAALPQTDDADDEESDGRDWLEADEDEDEDGEPATDEVFADWEQQTAEGGMIELALADDGPSASQEADPEQASAADEGDPGRASVADPAVLPSATAQIEMDRSQGHSSALEVAAAPRDTAGLPNESVGSETESFDSAPQPDAAPVETPRLETTPSA
jgi:hypothetical protein